MNAHGLHPAKFGLGQKLLGWLPVTVGLLVLYLPSLIGLFRGIWSQDEQMHGPVVLGIACWLIYRKWPEMEAKRHQDNPTPWGWLFFAIALVLYVIGRSQSILLFEIGSLIWLLVGIVLVLRGPKSLKAQWFSLFFMLFMVPLPSPVVDTVTMPMKMAVSYAAENILYAVGYPIARTGVTLQIGQYVLLVADACAGLHTLLTLEALGLLYLNIVQRDSGFRNVGLAILIVPISFTANVIRVITLILITYHFGDEAGQGFLHGFAGMVLFISALLLIIGLDSALQSVENYRHRSQGSPA
jgi:exosortase B